jgi:flagellar hook protein FlgE
MAGFNSAINASLSSMNESAATTASVSGNVANSDTAAYKRIERTYSALVGAEIGTVSGVSSNTRQLVDVQGEMRRTGVGTDLAIEGKGFAVVTDGFTDGKANNFHVTRDLSFKKDKTNMLVNSSGYYLLAWDVGQDNALPTTKALLSSLNGVNVTQWTSQAAATSEVEFSANLLSAQKVVGQSVANIGVVSTTTNPSPLNDFASKSDLLFPNPYNSLTAGEGLEVTVGQASSATGTVTKKILYGGFAQTYSFDDNGVELVGTSTDEIKIQTNGYAFTATRGNGTTNQAVLMDIANQINGNSPRVNGIKAQVFRFNGKTTLMIAPTNINQSLSFTGNDVFRNAVGLDNSKNTTTFVPDAEGITIGRFASLDQLSDALQKMNIPTQVIDNDNLGANINILSSQPIAFTNYQPLGKNSNFVAEFGLASGYLGSLYDPYLSTQNMASGAFNSHFSQNITIYDAMGNESNLLVSFLKTGVNKWAVEVHAVDPLSVQIAGRTDGLLMAGSMTFDGKGNFTAIEPSVQYSYSKYFASPNTTLGATPGQTVDVTVGSTTYSFVYGPLSAQSLEFSALAADLVGTNTDTFNITVGSNTYSMQRGSGTNNLDVLNNIVNQINAVGGGSVLSAKVLYDQSTSKYYLKVQAVDTTQSVQFTGTGGFHTALGITNTKDIATNSFTTLAELSEQINHTVGLNALKASLIRNPENDTYALRIAPANQGFYMNFGGTTATVNPPLGNGTASTITSALEWNNTSTATQLVSLDQALTIDWAPNIGANPNIVSFNWGIFGSSDGMTQVSGAYSVRKSTQNGVSVGNLTSVSIDAQGWVVASFSNSLTRNIYKIPVADFANPNGLIPMPGNTLRISKDSGPLNLKEAGMNGAGKFIPGTVEGSNVDIANELAQLILAQRQYQASSKVISVVDKLSQYLIDRTFN